MKRIAAVMLSLGFVLLSSAAYAETSDSSTPTGPVRTIKELQAVFNTVTKDVDAVLKEGRKENPKLNGLVTYAFTVEADGKVSECKVASTTANNPKVENAILDIFKKLDFKPASRPEKMTFQFPVQITVDDPKKK